jgi:NAD(P)-dependent dehydrogenase (short-subunit alcohol dehydrogenase family)
VPTVLVTGASRGLGLELVRQYAGDDWRVHACCRDRPAADLDAVVAGSNGRVQAHVLDVTDFDAVDALARRLSGEPIDVLLNNAGRYTPHPGQRDDRGQSLGNMDYEVWSEMLRVNALAPFKMTEAFLEHLATSDQRKLVVVSSDMASIQNTRGGFHAYRSSKAALNMLMASLAHELRGRGILVGILSPGWVRTRMGGPRAPVSVQGAAHGLRERIAALEPTSSGRFVRYDGSAVPW